MSSAYYVSLDVEKVVYYSNYVYDYFMYLSFIFKLFVMAFFINHFIKKTVNICNIFFYLMFIGFAVDVLAWVLTIADGLCWDIAKDTKECWAIDVMYVPFAHYNNTFSVFWMLLLSINRLTSIVSAASYAEIWKRMLAPSIVALFLLPFTIIGYSFVNYKCRFYLGCDDPNYWVTFGTVSAFGNGAIAVISFVISIATAWIYRKRKQYKTEKSSDDVKLIFQSGVTSFVCITHYVCYAIAETYRAYQKANPEYKFELGYVIIWIGQFMAFPGYHFSAFFYLFVFSTRLRRQFFEMYHLTWLYKLSCCQSETKVQTISPVTVTARMFTKSEMSAIS